MRASKEHKQWLKERDEAAYSFDVDKFRKFYEKWRKRGFYNMPLPSDEVIEISMRKIVCSLANPDEYKLAEARAWLSERGYSWSIYTDGKERVMTNLESTQENTSEFNIFFYLRQSFAEAMMQVFLFEPNRKKVEEMLKIKTEPYDVRDVILANMLNDIVKAYLSASFDGEDTADTPQTEREGE